MASDSNSGQYDQSGGGGVLPLRRAGLSLQRPPDPISWLVQFEFLDGKQRRRGAYTVTVGDREFIDRFERAGKP